MSQIQIGWVFELSWFSFWLILRGGGLPQPLFAKKSDFGVDGVKNFVANIDHSLVLAYPENLSQIRVGWVFGWFWWAFTSPLFCQKIGFWLRWGKFFCHQLWSFIVSSVPWKFEPNSSWFSFLLSLGSLTPFLPQNRFWLGWGNIFYHQLLLASVYPEIWAKSEFVEFLADFGVVYISPFCQEIGFWLWGGKICHHQFWP